MIDAALPERLARAITLGGPMPVAHYMAAANAHYYATRDPLGTAGDFTTAPEISQMFGEMVGLWLADTWLRSGQVKPHYVELGPGRGTLAADALRSMAKFGLEPDVHLVETSPVLRKMQEKRLPGATWHDDVSTLPQDGPLLVVANEFFDALPIHQLVKGADGWHERLVACQDTLFLPIAGKLVPQEIIPEALHSAPQGSIIETSPASVAITRSLADQIVAQGGVMIIIDYGYDSGPSLGETLQAVSKHAYANPFEEPGERDLTAHVDFETLGAMAEMCGARVHGPVGQGDWLRGIGIVERAATLKSSAPDRAADMDAAVDRLTSDGQMGRLFRAMAVSAPHWPKPEGFDAPR